MQLTKVPVRIRGIDYPSMTAAGRALGVCQSTIGKALDRGTIESVGLGLKNSVPTAVDGVWFSSIREAAEAIGVHHSLLYPVRCRARKAKRNWGKYKGLRLTWEDIV